MAGARMEPGDSGGREADRLAVMADPLRSAVVDCLVLSPATATELSAELGVEVERIRYQLKRLRRAGIVSVEGERGRRGAVEYVYIADSRKLVLPEEEMVSLSSTARRRQIPQSLRVIFKEALEATQAGAFHRREDCIIVRIPLRLDPRGFREVRKIIEAAAHELFQARERSTARLKKEGGLPRPATSVLLFFEVTP